MPHLLSGLDDLRSAARALSQTKGFTFTATVTLAIGVAGATLMFALVNGILLEPLPVREADRLIVAWKRTSTGTFSHYPFGLCGQSHGFRRVVSTAWPVRRRQGSTVIF
jgi:hypothetical protein